MKATGIVRRVDDLGRIVLPMEIRKVINIGPRESLEIFIDGNAIMLRKYEPRCLFCGSADNVKIFRAKNICLSCLTEIYNDLSACERNKHIRITGN